MFVVALLAKTPFTKMSNRTESKSAVIGHFSEPPVVTMFRPAHPLNLGVDFTKIDINVFTVANI